MGKFKLVKFLAAVMVTAGMVLAQTFENPLPFIYEGFEGGVPTGWEQRGGSWWNHIASEGINNSGHWRVALVGTGDRASAFITTANVSMGASPTLSFWYKATEGAPVSAGALWYTVQISTNGGESWTNLLTNVPHVFSSDFRRISVNVSAYANRTARIRITFNRNIDAVVWLDDLALGTVPPILHASQTVAAGDVFNNYSSMDINKRTYRIENKGATPLSISNIQTTGGITVAGLPSSLPAFSSVMCTLTINATGLSAGATYSGSFTFNINAPIQPTFTANVSGTVRAGLSSINENFNGTGVPAGWVLNANTSSSFGGWRHQSSGGINNSGYWGVWLGTGHRDYSTVATVRTANVAVGATPVLSFWYRATTGNSAATDGALLYTVSVSKDSGATWTHVLEDISHVSLDDFVQVTASLPDEFANQIIFGRITFNSVTDCFVWLDDLRVQSQVSISFNPNGGSVSPAFKGIGIGGGAIGEMPTPTRPQHDFVGWFTSATGGTQVTESRNFTSNATIFARWSPATYTITFDPNEGVVAPETGTTGSDWTLAELPVPVRDGYNFVGWFTMATPTGGSQITTNTVFSANTTIYARWATNSIVIFNNADGSLISTQLVEYGGAAIAPSVDVCGWDKAFDNVITNLTITAIAHDWNDWTILTQATCKTEGSVERICKNNEEHTETVIVPVNLLAHKWGDWSEFAATCVATGSRTRVCEHDNEHTETIILPALGHTLGNWTISKMPTCNEDGEILGTCTIAGCTHEHRGAIQKLSDCNPTFTTNRRNSDNRQGIILDSAVVSRTANISVALPEQATMNIVIFDAAGNVVHNVETQTCVRGAERNQCLASPNATPCTIVWNLTNANGRFVANGTYLVVVEATGISGRRFTYSSKIGVNR